MRYRFAREGIDTIIGHHFSPGAIKFEDREYPVTWSNSFMAEDLIGAAKDLRREDDGTLTAEIHWYSGRGEQAGEIVDNSKYGWLTIYGNEVVKKGDYPLGPGRPQIEINSLTLKCLFVCYGLEDPWTEGSYRNANIAANPEAFADSPTKKEDG
jgi:hypothetical protein